MTGRYVATGPEAEFEPGSRGRVLRNLLGITRVRDMNEAESQALVLAQEAALDRFGPEHRFTAEDICALHRLWLGPIYGWAGECRSVNIGKAGFQFAHAPLIPGLMAELPPLDFSPLAGAGNRAYIAGIHAAVGRNYAPLTVMFLRVIERSRRRAASSAR